MNALQTWQMLFGDDLLPNDCELVGLERNGAPIYYDAVKGTCYTDAELNIQEYLDTGGKFNEREYTIVNPLLMIVILKMKLKECSEQRTLKAVRAIVDHALTPPDGDKYSASLEFQAKELKNR